MTKAFEPILIGLYQDKIDEQTKSWKNAISCLNLLANSWNSYFTETLDLKELAVILNVPDLPGYIQKKHVRKNPKHADFIKTLNVKIDKLIEMVEIPTFGHLVQAVANVKAAIYPDPQIERQIAINNGKGIRKKVYLIDPLTEFEFEKWKAQIFDGQKFSFPPELEAEITERNSVYTHNERENAAYLYMVRLSELLNILNDCGMDLADRDFMQPVFHQFIRFSSGIPHSTLKHHRSENPMSIMHYRPSMDILGSNSSIQYCFSNLSDLQIAQLIEKLQS